MRDKGSEKWAYRNGLFCKVDSVTYTMVKFEMDSWQNSREDPRMNFLAEVRKE